MKYILVVAAFAFAESVGAQVCDVTYTVEVETAAGNDVSSGSTTIYGLPMADVLDNHAKNLKVLDALSKRQDKGGPYTIETGEYRACDGGAKTKIDAGSVMVKGVTLKGANEVARVALAQSGAIIKRYEDKSAKGAKEGWDHKKAKKVKRNDLGQKVKD